jgi:hypothetical protein
MRYLLSRVNRVRICDSQTRQSFACQPPKRIPEDGETLRHGHVRREEVCYQFEFLESRRHDDREKLRHVT